MSSTIRARVTHRFGAPAERVFDAWLDPTSIRRWLAAALRRMGLPGDVREVHVDPRVGGAFRFTDVRDGVETPHWGTYLELDRPRTIAFTWITDASQESDPSTVTLTLTPDGDGCTATLVHELDAAWTAYVARTEQGWSRMMEAVGERVGSR